MKAVFSVLLCGVVIANAQAQLPVLNSYPAATAVVYLDFDGQYVQGTSWNWGGPIDAQPAGLSSSAMIEIFNRVSEDYRIFNINITTDSSIFNSAPFNKRQRVIITPSSQWYGSAGGVAYIGSFTWGDDTPAWVFGSLLQNNPKYIAEAISHETGHTLALQHQSAYDALCNKTTEYTGGQGSGEISWAPIMGYPYSKNNTTWHLGTSAAGCSIYQDDIATIAGGPAGIGLRSDDHGNSHQQATQVATDGFGFTTNGLINHSNDKDVFSFPVNGQFHLQLSAIPQNVGSNNAGANADILISLLNSNGDTIGRYNPALLLNAVIDTNLSVGLYYLVVEGVGNINLLKYGSLGYYTIQANFNSILSANTIQLWGKSYNGMHQLNWEFPISSKPSWIEIEHSSNGLHFLPLARLTATSTSFSYKPYTDQPVYYRLKFLSETSNQLNSSRIILLEQTKYGGYNLVNTLGGFLLVQASENCSYQLHDANGRLLKKGNLQKGMNRIEAGNTPNGLLLLRLQHNSKTTTEKFVKQ